MRKDSKLRIFTNTGFYLSIMLALSIGTFLGMRIIPSEELEHLKREVSAYHENYQVKNGGSTLKGKLVNYELLSLDKGTTWYVVNDGKIVGDVNKVYPGLLKHIQGMEALYAYIAKKGAITEINSETSKILTDAGFTIKYSK